MKSLRIVFLMTVVFLAGCSTAIDYRIDGARHIEAGNYDAAISNLEHAVNLEPNSGNGHHWLGQAYYKKGRYMDAIIHFKRATELQGNVVHNYEWLASAYAKTQQYQEAIAVFKKAIRIDPTKNSFFRRLSQAYIEVQNYDEAITAAKRAIELNPDNDLAYHNLGYAYGKKKQYDEAFKAFRKAMELDPHALYPANYGDFLMEKGDYAEAERQFKRAVSLRPNNANYLLKLSHAYYLQGKYDDALDAAGKSVELSTLTGIGVNVQITDNYLVIASVIESGPAKRAGIEAGDRIIKIDGKPTKRRKIEEVVSQLKGQEGTRLVLTIKRENTSKSFEKTLTREKIIPTEATSAFVLRSLIQRYKGKAEGALKDAEQAYSLDPSDEQAKLALGAAHLDKGSHDEAIKLLSQVKDSATANLLEATAHAKQGDFNKAADIYSAIPEEKLSPNNVPLWIDRVALLVALTPYAAAKEERAGTLRAQGRYREALNELGEVLRVVDEARGREIYKTMAEILRGEPQLARVPEEARKYRLRGDVLTEEGNFKEAATQYRQAVNAAPYIAKLHFNTAIAYGELKSYFQAVRHMETYLLLAPEAPNARAVKDQIYKWEFRMEKGQ